MEKQKFETVLVLLVSHVFGLIAKRYGCDEITAVKEFYNFHVYALF